MCDNSSIICLSKKFVHYSWDKYIDLKHHLIKDHVLKGDLEISFMSSDFQLADIFTKPLLEERLCSLPNSLNNIGNSLNG